MSSFQSEDQSSFILAQEQKNRLLAETLRDITLSLASHHTYQEIFAELLRQVRRLVLYTTANVVVLQEDTLVPMEWNGYEARGMKEVITHLRQRVSDYPLDAVAINTRRPMIVTDTHAVPEWVVVPGAEWIRSYVSVPIFLQGEVFALLRLDSNTPGVFSSEDLLNLQSLANAAAVALENARLTQELRRNQERLRAFLNASQDLSFRLTADGVVIDYYVDEDVPLIVPPEQFVGANIRTFLPTEVADLIEPAIAAALETQRPQRMEYMLPKPQGKFYYETIITASGEDEVLLVERDVTERRQAERQVAQAERLAALGRLSASLAHEINNPLQAIQVYLELVLDFDATEAEKTQYLQIIRTEIENLSQTSKRILNFARAGAEDGHLISATNGGDKTCCLLLNERLRKNRIRVVTDFQDVPPVWIAPDHLMQILVNIAINAIEAIEAEDAPGVLDISIAREYEGVHIAFTNVGQPIADEALSRIFDPFFTTKEDGTGLGLWISYNLVRQYDGNISVSNSPDGHTVEVDVVLPAVRAS